MKWSRNPLRPPDECLVVQRHHCKIQVEDGDCEILLDADRGIIDGIEFGYLADLASYSGETFFQLYEASEMKDWVDPARERTTFYGQAPRTIRETFDHIGRTQRYYLSRTGLQVPTGKPDDFLALRKHCSKRLREYLSRNGNSTIFTIDNEKWSLKKILRRFIWHGRIHGKAVVRILQKQKDLGLINDCEDPFHFET